MLLRINGTAKLRTMTKDFMLLLEKDFLNIAAARYEQNEEFFVKMFSDPDMMRQVVETVGTVLYERLRGQKE